MNGSFCCRKGADVCCTNSGVPKVNLDEEGRLLSSSTVASGTATASQGTTTDSSGSDSGSGSGRDNGEALALKVGLGVGIPFAAVVAVVATWCFFRRRHRPIENTARGGGNAAAPAEPYSTDAKSTTQHYSPNINDQSPAVNQRYEIMGRPIEGAWDGVPRELGDR